MDADISVRLASLGGDTPSSMNFESRGTSPLSSGSESAFTIDEAESDRPIMAKDSPASESDISEFSDDSDESSAPVRKGKSKAQAKAKRGWAARGKGRRLEDDDSIVVSAEVSDAELDELDALDDSKVEDLQALRERKREERKRHEEEMEPIRKKERKLAKKIGRKLTNGEKNLIRLVKVS